MSPPAVGALRALDRKKGWDGGVAMKGPAMAIARDISCSGKPLAAEAGFTLFLDQPNPPRPRPAPPAFLMRNAMGRLLGSLVTRDPDFATKNKDFLSRRGLLWGWGEQCPQHIFTSSTSVAAPLPSRCRGFLTDGGSFLRAGRCSPAAPFVEPEAIFASVSNFPRAGSRWVPVPLLSRICRPLEAPIGKPSWRFPVSTFAC